MLFEARVRVEPELQHNGGDGMLADTVGQPRTGFRDR